MGKAKKGPKFAVMKKLVTSKALKQHKQEVLNPKKKDLQAENLPRNVPYVSSALFFKYNTALGPPYMVLVDTNFINFSIQNKLDLEKGMMDCLYAKCTPCITDCVMAELEKLGQKYRVALRIAKDPRFERLPCTHKGTYADDCIVDRVTQHKCYIVATCDRDLKRRIRKLQDSDVRDALFREGFHVMLMLGVVKSSVVTTNIGRACLDSRQMIKYNHISGLLNGAKYQPFKNKDYQWKEMKVGGGSYSPWIS
ncbi:hypothetical protein Cgig2_002319 [Carnegiea gigantea]|uniref:PIN domain-containing protein n=1 Tax=Carnegiea gigantea TaxID=171969 RepID=A0A9Q1Q975_9CARY|nr:hypothetical protein Cgig2_002319 [Carnegiea gigantea]